MTGLQYLASTVLPPMLQGIVGRWLLTKLFEDLRKRSLMPNTLEQWLYKPVDLEEVSTAALREAMAAVASADQGAVSRRVTAAFLDVMPSQDDVEDRLYSRSLHARVSIPDFDNVRTASDAPVRKPGVGSYPRTISEAGKTVWDEVMVDFSSEIEHLGKGDVLRQWATGLILLERLCRARGVRPYKPGTDRVEISPATHNRLLQKRLNKALTRGKKHTTDIVEQVFQDVAASGLRVGKPIWRGELFVMRMFVSLNMKSIALTDRKAIRVNLRTQYDFVQSRDNSMTYKPHKKMRHSLRIERESNREWRLYLEFPLRENEAIALTGQRNRIDIIKKLGRISKTWFNAGEFPGGTP